MESTDDAGSVRGARQRIGGEFDARPRRVPRSPDRRRHRAAGARRAHAERRCELVGRRGRRPDSHPRRSRQLQRLRRAGSPAAAPLLSRRASAGTGRGPGVPEARRGWAGLLLPRGSTVPHLHRTAARADPPEPRRRTDVRVPHRGLEQPPVPDGAHRLPRRFRELVRGDGRCAGRCQRARDRVQPRRGHAEIVGAAPVPDPPQPRRRRASLQQPGRGAGGGRAETVAPRGAAAPGAVASQPPMQPAEAGDRGGPLRRRERGAARGRPRRAAIPGPSEPLDPGRAQPTVGRCPSIPVADRRNRQRRAPALAGLFDDDVDQGGDAVGAH